jgi:hypothetical protein
MSKKQNLYDFRRNIQWPESTEWEEEVQDGLYGLVLIFVIGVILLSLWGYYILGGFFIVLFGFCGYYLLLKPLVKYIINVLKT